MSTMFQGIRAWSLGLALAGSCLVARTAHAENLQALIQRADRIFRGTTSAAVMTMQVKTRSYERTYKLVDWDDSRGGSDKTLVKILGPTSWRGYATLKLGSQLKFYDPKTNHIQTVGSSLLGDSWMGSHFSNDDLVKETRLAVDYSLSLIASRPGKDSNGGAVTDYRIKLVPKPSAPVAWGRIEFELWTRDDIVMPVETGYFTRVADATPARMLTFSKVKELGGRLVPSVLEMRLTSKPGEFTRLTYEELRFDVAIPDSKFTEQALR
jgi:hypothetical protein